MKKLLIHIGTPKTATTTLQESIFYPLHQKKIINYFGRLQFEENPILIEQFTDIFKTLSGSRFFNGDMIFNIPIDESLRQEALFKDEKFFVEYNLKKYRKLLKENIYNIYSDENLTAPYDFIATLEKIPNRLRRMFVDENTECKILITIRKQTETIPSVYAQKYSEYIKYDRYDTPQKLFFAEDNTLIKDERFLGHDYSYLIDAYKKEFGEENVIIAFFEELKENKFYYHELVAKILDLDIDLVKEHSTNNRYRDKAKAKTGQYMVNVPIMGWRQRLMKAIIYNKYSKGLKLLLNKFPLVSYKLKQLAKPTQSSSEVVPSLTQQEVEIIFNEYLESNHKLHTVHGISKEKLLQYGYIR